MSEWSLGAILFGGAFACCLDDITLDSPPAGSQSTATTPDGSMLVVINGAVSGYDRYTYDTSDWSLIETAAIADLHGAGTFTRIICAGDDGWIYNVPNTVGNTRYLDRYPILDANGAANTFATYNNASTPNAYNQWLSFAAPIVNTLDGRMYTGGQYATGPDGGTAAFWQVDRTTGALTLAAADPAWFVFEPWVATPDGAVWGWAYAYDFVPWVFRFQSGTLTIMSAVGYPYAFVTSVFYAFSDSSVGFQDGEGNGVRITASGVISDLDCLDGAFVTGDFNGPSAPQVLLPNGVPADAQVISKC